MRPIRKTMALFAILCLSLNAQAQFDDEYTVEDWTLDDEEEEAPKPQHKEYKNALYLQYSPSRYKVGDDNIVRFNEFLLGYYRNIQVIEEQPFFVEAGASVKFSWTKCCGMNARALTFRVPVNVLYKFYPWRDKDFAIAPFSGVSIRAIAMARDYTGEKSTNLLDVGGWKSFQVTWQTGLRFYLKRYFMGISYSRDFRDSSKYPSVRECGVHLGCCF